MATIAFGIHKVKTVPFSTLIENGTFYPATTLTAEVNKYQSFKKGWMIDFQMNNFFGSYVDGLNAGVPPPAPSTFDVMDVDVATWLDLAEANEVDYIVLNVMNEYGFKLWDSQTPYNMSQITLGDGHLSPHYQNYCIQPPYDTSVFQKFCDECIARGIEPCVYINSVNDWNVFHGSISNVANPNIPMARQNEWINYMARLMQEIIIRFGIKYIWIDYAGNLPAGMSQIYYNAIKSADPTCMVIGNALGEMDFARFPYDIESTEEHMIYSGNESYKTTSRTYGGTTYYVAQEIVATPYGQMSQWYYYDGLCAYLPTVNPFTGLPPWVDMLETDPATFQEELINPAIEYNRPFVACVIVDRYGVLVQDNIDYLAQFNWEGSSFPMADLVGHWNFEEASGGPYLDSYAGFGLSAYNGVTTVPGGKINQGVHLAAATVQFLLGSTGLSAGASGFTIAGWFKFDTTVQPYPVIISKGVGSTATFEYNIYYDVAQQTIVFSAVTASGANGVGSSVSYVNDGNWVFIVAKWDGAQITVSINNGTPGIPAVLPTFYNAGGEYFFVGNQPGGGNEWGGTIDLLGIWNRGLTAAEITTLYNGGAGLAL